MLLAVILLSGHLFMQGNPIVQPPPQSVNVTNNITVSAPPPDPEVVAESTQQSYQAVMVTMIGPTLVDWTNKLLDLPDVWRVTDPGLTYDNDGVKRVAGIVLAVAGSLIALVILSLAFQLMLGNADADDFKRPVAAVVMSVGNLTWWAIGIQLNNAINQTISAPALASIIRPHLALPSASANPADAFGPVILIILYALVALLLLGSMLFRLGLIDVLIVVGSLALLCKGSENSDGLYAKYVTLSVGTLFSQVLVVICLALAPVLGAIGTGIAGTLLGIVVLLLARRMPSMLASAPSGGGGLGRIGAVMVLRRLVFR